MDESDEDGSLSLGSVGISVPHPPPDQLVLRDETGQPWMISVRPDGQLQTARYPDGEPMTAGDAGIQLAATQIEAALARHIEGWISSDPTP